jgi:hypothetical protein
VRFEVLFSSAPSLPVVVSNPYHHQPLLLWLLVLGACRLRRPGVNNAFIGCHRLGLRKVQRQGNERSEAEDQEAEEEGPQEEMARVSLLDELAVLYFVAKARDAFRVTRRG